MNASIRENRTPDAASNPPAEPPRTPAPAQPAADGRADHPERAYSFGAYLRSHAGFAIGAVALVAVTAGVMAVTGSNASAIALVSFCEAAFACVALAAGFLRDREFYQQLDLFCDSPENARSATLSEDFSIEELNLAALARKACRQRSRTLIGARVSLEFAIDETLEVLADAKWTDFIIGQVLENSAKYGAKAIRFEGTTKDAGTKDGCIELLIADDGDGIPAADVPRVFDRGFTGSRGRTHHKATGMGLHLAAVACERMGLGLRISSEEGTGTTVALIFPLDRTRMDLARS